MSSQKVAKNALMLYIRMGVMLVVNLYMSRVVLNTLGVTDFGIYNVTGGVVLMFSFISNTMASASQRFFSYEIGKKSVDRLQKLFSVTFSIYILFSLIIFLLAETVGFWFVEKHLVIPSDRYDAAKFVYHMSILSFLFTILRVPYTSFILANERMSFFAWISIIESILKLSLVFALVYLSFDKLKLYSLSMLIVIGLITISYYIYCKVNFQATRFSFVKEPNLYKEMSSYAGWNSFTSIANISVDQGINILLNIFFGPAINAARSISFQVKAQVTTFVGNIQMAANPQIVKLYAAGKIKEMESIVYLSSRITYYCMLLISVPLLLETETILKLWLIQVPEHTVLFTRLVIINILVETISGTVTSAIQATGKIKRYQVIVGFVLITSVPLSYILLYFGYPPEVTVVLTTILSTACVLIRINIYKDLFKTTVLDYFKKVILSCLLVSISSLLIPLILKLMFLKGTSILEFVLISALSLFSTLFCIVFIGVTKEERLSIIKSISTKLNKGKN